MVVAAAAAPPGEPLSGGRLLQLRVSTLGRYLPSRTTGHIIKRYDYPRRTEMPEERKLPLAWPKVRLKYGFRGILPYLEAEIDIKHLPTAEVIDQRIARLADIKQELEAAVLAVDDLQRDATARKAEVADARRQVERMNEQRTTAEALLKLPHDSVLQLLTEASAKGRMRGIIEGAVVGFGTGTLSSFLVWYLTTH